jgi:hypothetical protein
VLVPGVGGVVVLGVEAVLGGEVAPGTMGVVVVEQKLIVLKIAYLLVLGVGIGLKVGIVLVVGGRELVVMEIGIVSLVVMDVGWKLQV